MVRGSRRPGFRGRPYYPDPEIERIAEEELGAVRLLPSSPEPIRIDRFIEKRFGIPPAFEELPPGVLGLTQFGPSGVQAILISRVLSEERTRVSERRLSTTLAHEAGHGLLHAHLFADEGFTSSLFQDSEDVTAIGILCRDEGLQPVKGKRYDGRWWEFQANRMMGSLLLPASLVQKCIRDVLITEGRLGARTLPDRGREAAARRLSDMFDVNPVVARIRLQGLYPVGDESQLTL